jgi:tyrosyl-tRNA synthetase
LTLLSIDEIQNIKKEHKKNPEKRYGQKKLAYEVVKIIHGEKEAEISEKISDFLF